MIEKVHPSISDRGVGPVLFWSAFLGSSWTWIIGMVLPVLLVNDFGFLGWVAFAVPNVIGAAAMGFVLPTAAVSRRVTGMHRDMCLRFSEVTITFHFFVISWLYFKLFGTVGVVAPCVLAVVLWVMVLRRPGTVIATLAVTIPCIVVAIVGMSIRGAWTQLGEPHRLDMTDWILFIPASVLGFALCPYLDLTFHRARQSTSRNAGKLAFLFGFGIVFALFITLSLAYSGILRPVLYEGVGLDLPGGWWTILFLQLTLQAGFTVAIHAREISMRMKRSGIVRVFFLAAGGLLLGWIASGQMNEVFGKTVAEVGYRTFLLAYGLPFPAYVWLCMIPTRRRVVARGKVIVWAITVLAGFPVVFGYFIGNQAWWILYLLGILVIARVVVELLPAVKEREPVSV
ncbi:hypothetical protein [Poriferisphaera sp. WC338]|uniref:hypothetical protein n=1 Tax=Poriferisphaera sp. WC338 TaxID=3425129 RepID=UPI003D81BF3D